MKIPSTSIRSYGLHISSVLFILPLFLLLIGCGSKGVKLQGFVPGTGTASLTTGDGGTCTSCPCTIGTPAEWNDSFITPTSSFTVAMKSAALIQQGATSPSYTIFDSGDIAKPVIESFLPGTTQTFGINPDFPADGTYDRIQYVVSYYQAMIPINYQNLGSNQRRVRLYLAGFIDQTFGNQSVFQNDILIDNPSGTLSWINAQTGLDTQGFYLQRPVSNVLQEPASQLITVGSSICGTNGNGCIDSLSANPYTFTIILTTPLGISGSPNNQFTIQVTFDTTAIFQFDMTCRDSSKVRPINNNNFIPPLLLCKTDSSGYTIQNPCDGRLDAKPPANFWLGLPAVTAETQ